MYDVMNPNILIRTEFYVIFTNFDRIELLSIQIELNLDYKMLKLSEFTSLQYN